MWRAHRRLLLSIALALAAAGGPVAAQHPIGPATRPLHVRLAQADAVAVVTVREVQVGRLLVAGVRPLRGELPAEFLVKRAPAAPPPLEVGDRALLLLRGARPPYALVDRPEETIRLADAEAEAAWSDAVRGWLRVRARPAAWVPLFLAWIERGPDTLRDLAVQALIDPGAPFQPLAAAFYADRGRAAWDATRPPAARRAASQLAALHADGRARLVAGLLAAPPDCDPAVAQAALAAASSVGPAEAGPLLARGLEHTDTEVRRSALQAARLLRGEPGPELRARLVEVARSDPESWLRAEAERTLAGLGDPGAR